MRSIPGTRRHRSAQQAVVLLTTVLLGTAAATSSQEAVAPIVSGHTLRHRWVYLPTNFQVAANVDRLKAVLDRANAAGYNGALLSDVKFGRLDDGSLPTAYYTNLRAVLEHARTLGMEVLPATANFGYSEAILWHNPNLTEGLPVREAFFRATAGQLIPYEAVPLDLPNGDFEQLPDSGDRFPGWDFQDEPSRATFIDQEVSHSGRASLRMENLRANNPSSGNGRVYKRLKVRPFQHYHASVWIRTQNWRGGEARLLALGDNPNRTLQWSTLLSASQPVRPTQDWTRYDATFNSLTHSEIRFYLGVWAGGTGTIWWDDATIEPAGFVNLIRRPGAPLDLASADGSAIYEERTDVEPIADPRMGTSPWPGSYDSWHEPPTIRLTEGSRIHDGDIVKANYYHAVTIYRGQVTASLTEPQVFDIVRGQMLSLRREFGLAGMFRGWMFSHDEIRVHGWDETPKAGGGMPGENLAYNFRVLNDEARAIDPHAQVLTWSDMFDPHHNAGDTTDPYYLVNGNWSGSWLGLPPEVIILNWNSQASKRRASAEFFAGRGHRQILAGYYDRAPDRFYDREWLEDLRGVPGIEGVMYTQWSTGYDNLEAWAQHVWGAQAAAFSRSR